MVHSNIAIYIVVHFDYICVYVLAYELRLESVKLQITNLDEQTLSLKETATSLGRQYIVNKDTINRYVTFLIK